jgi:hypothetical protein
MFKMAEHDGDLNNFSTNLLDRAFQHLHEADLRASVLESPDELGHRDGLVRVDSTTGGQTYELQIKSRVSPSSAASVRPGRTHLLIVTRYVPESVAQAWRARDIHFVDTAGNMFLRWPGLLVDVRGRRDSTAARTQTQSNPLRAFRPSGQKVLFALLSKPELASATYRDIAQASDTSLGTVQAVIKELVSTGHMLESGDGRRLHRTRRLFDRWVEAYALELYPKLTFARFDSSDPNWWRSAKDALLASGAQWGGETAANILDDYLRPARTIVYAREVPKRLVLENRLRKAQGEGDVEIRKKFWKFEPTNPLIVPTPLVYADLMASADPRQIEQAQRLREGDGLLRRIDRD